MLHEELRRYRQRLGEQEGTIATQDRTIAALRVSQQPAPRWCWPLVLAQLGMRQVPCRPQGTVHRLHRHHAAPRSITFSGPCAVVACLFAAGRAAAAAGTSTRVQRREPRTAAAGAAVSKGNQRAVRCLSPGLVSSVMLRAASCLRLHLRQLTAHAILSGRLLLCWRPDGHQDHGPALLQGRDDPGTAAEGGRAAASQGGGGAAAHQRPGSGAAGGGGAAAADEDHAGGGGWEGGWESIREEAVCAGKACTEQGAHSAKFSGW